MGKGKGAYLRRAFKSRIFSPLIEFIGVDYYKILEMKRFLQTKIHVKLAFAHQPVLYRGSVGKKNISFTVFKKYNFI